MPCFDTRRRKDTLTEHMQEKLTELKSRLLQASDLRSAAAVLYWDQATYMPPGGAEARGRQLGQLLSLIHI